MKRNLVKLSKAKCKVLQKKNAKFCKDNVKFYPWKAERLAVLQAGNGLVAGSSVEKVLGVITGSKLSISQQCGLARANSILHWISRHKTHPEDQGKCLFPFIWHSLDQYKTILSRFGPLHVTKALINRSKFSRSNHDTGDG